MIKKVNKVEPAKKESTYEERERVRNEKREKEKQKEKQKELDIIAEKEHAIKIITPYMASLDNQLTEKKLNSFWVFPDRSGFKKINGMTFTKMQKFIYQDVDKYKDRKLCKFSIIDYYKDEKKNKEPNHYWLVVDLTVYHIDDTGNMLDTYENWGCTYAWKDQDFKLTKFSFKLLEKIMYLVVEKKFQNESILGIPLTSVIKHLEKKGIDFSDLSPLAGL